MSNYFEFYNPVKICSGKNALSNLPNELENLNAKKPFALAYQGYLHSFLFYRQTYYIAFVKYSYKYCIKIIAIPCS